MYMFRLAEWVR